MIINTFQFDLHIVPFNCVACDPLLCPQQQSVKEDVFPDAEGWENVDPDEAAKWSVGSEFAPGTLEQSQTEGGAAAEIPPVIVDSIFFNMCLK